MYSVKGVRLPAYADSSFSKDRGELFGDLDYVDTPKYKKKCQAVFKKILPRLKESRMTVGDIKRAVGNSCDLSELGDVLDTLVAERKLTLHQGYVDKYSLRT